MSYALVEGYGIVTSPVYEGSINLNQFEFPSEKIKKETLMCFYESEKNNFEEKE